MSEGGAMFDIATTEVYVVVITRCKNLNGSLIHERNVIMFTVTCS